MDTDPNKVLITAAETAQYQATHKDFPELRAEGETAETAASNLAEDLAREIDGAPDDLHRDPLRRALADVRAFLGQAR